MAYFCSTLDVRYDKENKSRINASRQIQRKLWKNTLYVIPISLLRRMANPPNAKALRNNPKTDIGGIPRKLPLASNRFCCRRTSFCDPIGAEKYFYPQK